MANEPKTKVPEGEDKLDVLTKSIESMFDVVSKIEARITDLETVKDGGDPEFEKSLKESNNIKDNLTPAERSWYGEEAPVGIRKIVGQILGADFVVLMKTNEFIPTSLVTVMVPKRLSGKDKDFRSVSVNNVNAEPETRKWTEMVKSKIHRDWFAQKKGAPQFRII